MPWKINETRLQKTSMITITKASLTDAAEVVWHKDAIVDIEIQTAVAVVWHAAMFLFFMGFLETFDLLA